MGATKVTPIGSRTQRGKLADANRIDPVTHFKISLTLAKSNEKSPGNGDMPILDCVLEYVQGIRSEVLTKSQYDFRSQR